jgi:hypothetical protein
MCIPSPLVKFFKWSLIIAFPVIVLVFLTLPVIDKISPWDAANSKIQAESSGDFSIYCVGISSSSSGNTSIEQRSYVSFSPPKIITVTSTDQQNKMQLTLAASTFGFWFVAIFFLSSVALTFFFSLPRIRKN